MVQNTYLTLTLTLTTTGRIVTGLVSKTTRSNPNPNHSNPNPNYLSPTLTPKDGSYIWMYCKCQVVMLNGATRVSGRTRVPACIYP